MGLEPQTSPRPSTVPTTEAGEGSTLSGSIGYEPGHHARSSRDFRGHSFGTSSDVDFSLMPDDMFEALSTLEPMSVSIQPLDHLNLVQPARPFAGR
ncbi:uncharacterized protein PG998_002946 [Apiospora kogelbergensis]|uniref:uncharacterized protein n=1 Tax=Apiospora kogelbergensis TaxID=1337665 RepID=UPI0031326489